MKTFRTLFLLIFSMLLFLEIVLRVIGIGPISDYPVSCNFGSNGNFHEYNNLLGITNKPGNYSRVCEFEGDSLAFSVTNNFDNSRATSKKNEFDSIANKILFLGCSFTYGHGLNDTNTMAWKIQEKLTNFNIINLGITATGTLQAYLNLKENLKNKDVPKFVFYNYGSLHNERNVMAWNWWRPIWDNRSDVLGEKIFPYACFVNDTVTIKYKPAKDFYSLFPLRRKSAMAKVIEDFYNGSVSDKVDSYQVTLDLILNMKKLADDNEIIFVVPYFSTDEISLKMINDLNSYGITTIDISVDNKRENYLKEWDKHPSEQANKLFAEKILKYLDEQAFIELN